MTPLSVTMLDVPQGFCPANYQELLALIQSNLQISLPGTLNTFNDGNTTPAAEDRDKPWFRANADGTPDRWYRYANGQWLSRYTGPDTGTIMLWDGLEANIPTIDGGEVAAVTLTTGPFWERLTSMDGRFPIGVGVYGSTTVAIGDVGGAHEVVLDLEQIPPHDHGILGLKLLHYTPTTGTLSMESGDEGKLATFQSSGGKTNGATKAHDNMPPYKGLFFIKRTSRIYHRA